MQRGLRVLCMALVLLFATAGKALALGTLPKDALIVSHPGQLALIAVLSGRLDAEQRPAGLTLQKLYDHTAARLTYSGILPYSIRGDGCEPIKDRKEWFKEPCDVFLEVAVTLLQKGVFSVTLRFHRNLEFNSGDRTYYVNATTWSSDGDGEHQGNMRSILVVMDRLVDSFLSEYTRANGL